MYHKIYKVMAFEIVGDYLLQVSFDDHTEQTINFEPVLHGEMWGPLRDLNLFNQVGIDPETLRNWPEYCDELANRAQAWDKVFA